MARRESSNLTLGSTYATRTELERVVEKLEKEVEKSDKQANRGLAVAVTCAALALSGTLGSALITVGHAPITTESSSVCAVAGANVKRALDEGQRSREILANINTDDVDLKCGSEEKYVESIADSAPPPAVRSLRSYPIATSPGNNNPGFSVRDDLDKKAVSGGDGIDDTIRIVNGTLLVEPGGASEGVRGSFGDCKYAESYSTNRDGAVFNEDNSFCFFTSAGRYGKIQLDPHVVTVTVWESK